MWCHTCTVQSTELEWVNLQIYMFIFLHSFNKYLLNICCMQGTISGTSDTKLNKTDTVFVLLTVLEKEKDINQIIIQINVNLSP